MVATNQKSFSVTKNSASEAAATPEAIDLPMANVSIQASTLIPTDKSQAFSEQTAVKEQPVDQARSILQLPSDFLKTPTTTYQPKSCTVILPERLVESLQKQAYSVKRETRYSITVYQ